MRFLRNRAAAFGALALLCQVTAVAAVSIALSCGGDASSAEPDASGHEGMADCPMQRNEPQCPLHADSHGSHDCDCPTLSCSQSDSAFLALFGQVGVLPTPGTIDTPFFAGPALIAGAARPIRLTAVPPSPPPRA